EARTKLDAGGKLVWLAAQHGTDLEIGRTDVDTVADLQPAPRQQSGRRGGPENAGAFGEQRGKIERRLKRQFAVERIGAVRRLDLDERRAAVRRLRHRAQGGGDGHLAKAGDEGFFLCRGFALDQVEGNIAAKDHAAFARKAVIEAPRHRADTGNGK